MTNYSSGHQAEKDVAEYLSVKGFEILELNWKVKTCEIDIVAKKDAALYFIEVKSRKTSIQGSGFEYITLKKLQQMTYAAQVYVSWNNWSNDYRLAAASVDGGKISFIEL